MMEERTQALESNHSSPDGKENGNGAGESSELRSRAHLGLRSNAQPVFEPVLDSGEAAALLKIHPKTLQKLARKGRIPGFRIGKLWGFRASALNRWLERETAT